MTAQNKSPSVETERYVEDAFDFCLKHGLVEDEQAVQFRRRKVMQVVNSHASLSRQNEELRKALDEIAEHPGPNADDAAWHRVEIAKAALATPHKQESGA